MGLLDNMPHEASAFTRTRTLDALGGAKDVYSQVVFTDRDCWLQQASNSEVREFQKQGINVTGKVFFTSDPELDSRYALNIVSKDGTDFGTWLVVSGSKPDAGAGLAAVFKVMVEKSTTGSTPALSLLALGTLTLDQLGALTQAGLESLGL